MIVKTYEDEYRDCQKAFLKLVSENKKLRDGLGYLKAEIERKDEAIDTALDYLDDHRLGSAKEILKNALSEEE